MNIDPRPRRAELAPLLFNGITFLKPSKLGSTARVGGEGGRHA